MFPCVTSLSPHFPSTSRNCGSFCCFPPWLLLRSLSDSRILRGVSIRDSAECFLACLREIGWIVGRNVSADIIVPDIVRNLEYGKLGFGKVHAVHGVRSRPTRAAYNGRCRLTCAAYMADGGCWLYALIREPRCGFDHNGLFKDGFYFRYFCPNGAMAYQPVGVTPGTSPKTFPRSEGTPQIVHIFTRHHTNPMRRSFRTHVVNIPIPGLAPLAGMLCPFGAGMRLAWWQDATDTVLGMAEGQDAPATIGLAPF